MSEFILRLRPKKGTNPILSLRRGLKYLLRCCGLRALSIDEIPEKGRLTYPRAFPIGSWSDLDQAKRRAESLALKAIGLAGIKTDDGKPHPMGKPLNRETNSGSTAPFGLTACPCRR